MTVMEALRTARFIVDGEGNRTDVVLSLEAWEALVGQFEELEDLKLVHRRWASRAERSDWPTLDQVVEELVADGLLQGPVTA